jgi:cation transport regulator ChaC
MEYNFIGYGSLISHKSLRETVKDRKFKPVIVKGFKRIFNLRLNEREGDVLNVVKDRRCFFNGVMFRVNDSELVKLKEREDDYNLEEAEAYDFSTKKKLGKGFVVVDYMVGIDKKKRKPSKSYFELCREAAYHISKEFGKMWDETTYTSNGKSVREGIGKEIVAL